MFFLRVIFLYLIFPFIIETVNAQEKKQTVCLNMIVKDESKVITRCLESIKPLIDYWVIVDTGSSDNTREIIKEYMKDIPGKLYERPWKNFGYNRNEALILAKGNADYILFIDADEVLEFDSSYTLPLLEKDFYYIMTRLGGTKYARVQLIKDKLNWEWKGVLHEYVDTPEATSSAELGGITNFVRYDGFRSTDPQKYLKDAAILQKAVEEDPANTRNVFYLAQSYKDAGNHAKGLEYYQRRVEMGGWDQEIFYSLLQIGLLKEVLNYPSEEIIDAYYKAFSYRPTRAEPLYWLAGYYRRSGNNAAGYLISKAGLTIPTSNDLLFVDSWIYDYGLLFEYSICSYWLSKYQESFESNIKILSMKNIPQNIREAVERNLKFIPAQNRT